MSTVPGQPSSGLEVGDVIESSVTVSAEDIASFSSISGDCHPLHTDREFAVRRGHRSVVAHGMLLASKAMAQVAENHIGPDSVLVGLTGEFRLPVTAGETLSCRTRVVSLVPGTGMLAVSWELRDGDQRARARGRADIRAGGVR